MAANMAGRESLWLVQARNLYGQDPTELIHLNSSQPTHDALTNQQTTFLYLQDYPFMSTVIIKELSTYWTTAILRRAVNI
jgi:hypothetical protein